MNPTIRNILAVVGGAVTCVLINGLVISISGKVIPPPPGVDVSDANSLAAHIDEFTPKHFLFPFLAHALGSLAGGCIAAWIAVSRKLTFALVVGGLHLIGGIAAAFMIPAPAWFVVLDLTVAYLPMAWLGGRFMAR